MSVHEKLTSISCHNLSDLLLFLGLVINNIKEAFLMESLDTIGKK